MAHEIPSLCIYCYLIYFAVANFRFTVDGEQKYLGEVQELIRPERNTLTVSFEDVEKYNQQLATTVLEEYYRYRGVVCYLFNREKQSFRKFPRVCPIYGSFVYIDGIDDYTRLERCKPYPWMHIYKL